MTITRIFGAALVVAALAAPASAQQAVSEPGAFSFYHPNADVLNAGAPTPSAIGALPSPSRDAMASMQMSVRPHHVRHHAMRRY
jgi:hypothetical protein